MSTFVRGVMGAQMLVLALITQSAAAATGPYVSYNLANSGDDTVVNSAQWVYASGATHGPAGGNDGTGQASLAARAGAGQAQLSLGATGFGFSSFASAGWADQVVIDAPGLTGTKGTISFELQYDLLGSVNLFPVGQGSLQSYVSAYLRPLDGSAASQSATVSQLSTYQCGMGCSTSSTWDAYSLRTVTPSFTDHSAVVTLNVVFGQTYSMSTTLAAEFGGSTSSQAGSAGIDATLLWGGITAVTGTGGQAVTNYSIASAIGLDYASAVTQVPEPRSMMLMAAGLMLLAGLRRRTR